MIFMELSNEHVGAAIRREAGGIYVYSVYIGFILVLIGNIFGFYLGKGHKNGEKQTAP